MKALSPKITIKGIDLTKINDDNLRDLDYARHGRIENAKIQGETLTREESEEVFKSFWLEANRLMNQF